MLTSFDILETLDKHADVIVQTLNDAEKRQFIELLSAVTQAENEHIREDAVDTLDDFCRNFRVIDGLLNDLYNVYRGGNRGKPEFELTEAEQKLRLYANRLIKATEASLEKERTPKEQKTS